MITIEDVKVSLMLHPRFNHSIGVMKMALKLNAMHRLGIDEDKIKIASLLHDIAKNIDVNEQIELLLSCVPEVVTKELYDSLPVIHAFCGKVIAKYQYNIEDEEILDAIFYHTTGRSAMSNLEKLIFLSDYTEEGRIGENFEQVRSVSYKSIDEAIVKMLEQNFEYIKSKNMHIHSLSLDAYNYYKGVTKC